MISASVLPRFVHQLGTGFHFLHGVFDEVFDFFCGACAALREGAHFGRNNRKAATLLTGARGLDRGVKRQSISLERDLVDHADDVGNLAARRINFAHRIDCPVYDRAAALRLFARARC